ncbi:MAG: hypothetical protein SGILL_009431, partial [Bacillariaceae sp.]
RPVKLQLVLGETNPSERNAGELEDKEKVFEVEDVTHLGSVVHAMQEDLVAQNNAAS